MTQSRDNAATNINNISNETFHVSTDDLVLNDCSNVEINDKEYIFPEQYTLHLHAPWPIFTK
eukprot:12894255-Heterocapsa_arctica.AAC.1